MALTATLFRFQVELADIERGVYETLALRPALHPSEDAERLVVRVLAMCLYAEEGLEFGRGLSTPEDPALQVCGADGEPTLWIDVGAPAAERLHRARKRVERVAVVTHKDRRALARAFGGRRIHAAATVEVVHLDSEFVRRLADSVQRHNDWVVTIQDGLLSVSVDDGTLVGEVRRGTLDDVVA